MTDHTSPLALVTGGSAGLGRALVHALADRGWCVITDGRDAARLTEAAAGLDHVTAIAGDVDDPAHREHLVAAVRAHGPLDLLVHNASTLGPLPMPTLADLETDSLAAIWSTNAGAPHALTRALLPDLQQAGGVLLSLSSDAAVQHYEGWGGYGAAKAALDHLTLTFAAETGLTAYAVDPGDMNTQMHADAEPGEDLSGLPSAESVVPHLLALLDQRPESGRYRAADFAAAGVDKLDRRIATGDVA
jgi:NAD(P)-dependent dehydrogenase (short-subunit alcohol dehydrogenase family)